MEGPAHYCPRLGRSLKAAKRVRWLVVLVASRSLFQRFCSRRWVAIVSHSRNKTVHCYDGLCAFATRCVLQYVRSISSTQSTGTRYDTVRVAVNCTTDAVSAVQVFLRCLCADWVRLFVCRFGRCRSSIYRRLVVREELVSASDITPSPPQLRITPVE